MKVKSGRTAEPIEYVKDKIDLISRRMEEETAIAHDLLDHSHHLDDTLTTATALVCSLMHAFNEEAQQEENTEGGGHGSTNSSTARRNSVRRILNHARTSIEDLSKFRSMHSAMEKIAKPPRVSLMTPAEQQGGDGNMEATQTETEEPALERTSRTSARTTLTPAAGVQTATPNSLPPPPVINTRAHDVAYNPHDSEIGLWILENSQRNPSTAHVSTPAKDDRADSIDNGSETSTVIGTDSEAGTPKYSTRPLHLNRCVTKQFRDTTMDGASFPSTTTPAVGRLTLRVETTPQDM